MSGRNRRKFTPEFKAEAVRWSSPSGGNIAKVAKELGVYSSTLGNWVRQAREEAAGAPLSSKRPPGLRQAVLLAMWDDENAAASFADTHPLAQPFADNGFHAVLRPLRAFGAWPGLPDAVPRTRVTQHNGPVIVTTLGRLRMSQTLRFLRASRPAERAALKADGLVWGTAASRPARRAFMSTVSVWSSDEAAATYAYADADAGHPQAIARQRRKDFHHESAFIRYAIVSTSGTLPGVPPLDSAPRVAG